MILVRYIRDFLLFTPIAILGWFKVLFRLLVFLFHLWKQNSYLKQLAIIVFAVQLVFSTRPWFEYKINFIGTDEFLAVSSKMNLIFIILSLFNFILLITSFAFSNAIIMVLEIVMTTLFILGYESPTSIHIDFLKTTDYRFNTNFYIYAGGLAFALLLSIRNFLAGRVVTNASVQD